MRTEARFPTVDPAAGHYESFYLKANEPRGGRAVWIRYTVHKRPGAEATCTVWFTFFDAERGRPRAAKANFGPNDLDSDNGGYLRVAESRIGPSGASGALSQNGLEASWELRFEDRNEPLRHLPSERMYSARLPRTKLLSPHPGAVIDGTLELDGERIELGSWPGMVGHNWGAEHAERWVWLQGGDFEGGSPGDYLDVAAGRIKLGPLRTPWIANGMLVLDGTAYRLGGLRRTYGTEVKAEPGSCEFVFAGKGITVRGTASAPRERFVGWVYADPDPSSGEHHAINCSIADLELRVERPDHKHLHLAVAGGAAYELGMREQDHGVEIQPDPDG